jgi:hypothetical protein
VLQQADLIFSQTLECDGTKTAVITGTTCSILVTTLMAAPYSQPWGSSIYAKISATNAYGDSSFSTSGNGAKIITYPDAPKSLANVALVTSAYLIGLTWATGAANGGSAVLDYKIIYD